MKNFKKKKWLYLAFLLKAKYLFFSNEKINTFSFEHRMKYLREANYFFEYLSYYKLDSTSTKIRPIFTNEISNMTRIAGKYIFEGYYTEDMITPKIRWYHKIYKWKAPMVPLAFERPRLPRLSETKYDFNVAHVPFQFVHMFDVTVDFIILSKYWYMPRDIERLKAQRYWRDYTYLIRYFCKFFNLSRITRRLRKTTFNFYLKAYSSILLIRGKFRKLHNDLFNGIKDFEFFCIRLFKMFTNQFFYNFSKLKMVSFLFLSSKLDSYIYRFNISCMFKLLHYKNKYFKTLKANFFKRVMHPNIFIKHKNIYIFFEIFFAGFVVNGIHPGMFSDYFFYYTDKRILQRNFKVLDFKAYRIKIDAYSMYLYWTRVETVRRFKYRESLMYSYTMNYFSMLRHRLIKKYLNNVTKNFYREIKFYRLYYESTFNKGYVIYTSFRIKIPNVYSWSFDNFKFFLNSNNTLHFLPKMSYYSFFYSTCFLRFCRASIIFYAHRHFQRLSLNFTYRYRLYRIHYHNYADNYFFLRYYQYPYILSIEFIPYYISLFMKKIIKSLYKPMIKFYLFSDLRHNLYNIKEKFFLDSLFKDTTQHFIIYHRYIYVILQSIMSTHLFVQNLWFLLSYNYHRHHDVLVLMDEFYDHIFLWLITYIKPYVFKDLYYFYFTFEFLHWRLFSFDPYIYFLRKDLKQILIFRKLDIDLIFYSRYKIYRNLFYYSFLKNKMIIDLYYYNFHGKPNKRLTESFNFNIFFKFDILKGILFKLLARSFEYILINFCFLKNKINFFNFYITKLHTLKIYKKFAITFLGKHATYNYWNKHLKIYGKDYYFRDFITYRDNAIHLDIFKPFVETKPIDWLYYKETYFSDRPFTVYRFNFNWY